MPKAVISGIKTRFLSTVLRFFKMPKAAKSGIKTRLTNSNPPSEENYSDTHQSK